MTHRLKKLKKAFCFPLRTDIGLQSGEERLIICRTDTGLESGKEELYSQDRQANRVEQKGFTHRTDTG